MKYFIYLFTFAAFLLIFLTLGKYWFKQSLRISRIIENHIWQKAMDLDISKDKKIPLKEQMKAYAGRFGGFGILGKVSTGLKEELKRADIPLRAEEFVGFTLIISLLTAIFTTLLTKSMILSLLMFTLSLLFPFMSIRIRQKRRLLKFNDQLVDMLTVTANALKSGYSFQQAIQLIAKETPPPMSVEFYRLQREISLGMDTDVALNALNERLQSKDLDLIITAIMIQRQTGGNLAEILEGISSTIRDRVQMKREIRTITGQARMSGYIMMILPIALGAFLILMSPDIYKEALSTSQGFAGVGIIVVFQVLAAIFINKIVRIEI